MLKVAFVITNYNNSKYTLSFVDSVSQNFSDYVIIIIDNNSDNISKLMLSELIKNKKVHIKFLNENIGYFPGLNCGLDYLYSINFDPDYTIVGNNDILFESNFQDNLITLNQNLKDKYVISPNITTIKGIKQNPHVINKISILRQLVYNIYYYNYYLSRVIHVTSLLLKPLIKRRDEQSYMISQYINQGHGSCYILTPNFVKKFKYFLAPTFLMGEEYFLFHQLNLEQKRIWYESNLKIIHVEHSSIINLPSRKIWTFSKIANSLILKYES